MSPLKAEGPKYGLGLPYWTKSVRKTVGSCSDSDNECGMIRTDVGVVSVVVVCVENNKNAWTPSLCDEFSSGLMVFILYNVGVCGCYENK